MAYHCSECGNECQGEFVDTGIGPYEFWGRPCNDTKIEFLSECCEGDVLDEEGNLVDPPQDDGYDEYEDDEPDGDCEGGWK